MRVHHVGEVCSIFLTLALALGLASGCSSPQGGEREPLLPAVPGVDATQYGWPEGSVVIELENPLATDPDLAVFRRAEGSGRPAVIVIHGWFGNALNPSGNTLIQEAIGANAHYLYPNVRGPHTGTDNCCSDVAMADLDSALRFLSRYADVEPSQVFFVAASGGGYTSLCYLMSRDQALGGVRAWVPITNLIAFHDESSGSPYEDAVRGCTGSDDELDEEKAARRSPFFMPRAGKIGRTPLAIFAGINDGHDGPVAISHSLDFYNRLAQEANTTGVGPVVYDALMTRDVDVLPQLDAKLDDRVVYYEQSADFGRLVVFEGGHEMLPNVALARLGEED